MKTLILPLDSRPVTYLYPQLVAQVAGIETLAPPRHLMGSLNEPAKALELINWVETVLIAEEVSATLLCIDSIAYGGLISSRRNQDTLGEILERLSCLSHWKAIARKAPPVFVQSSIMRISDNYDASEEKEYWTQYGRVIFTWSQYLYKLAHGEDIASDELRSIESRIPQTIRQEYLASRHRNCQVNRHLIRGIQSGTLDMLVFSLDDSGEFGLNVLEKERLLSEVSGKGLSKKVLCYPGSDEVLCTLLARWLVSTASRAPIARIEFSPQCVSGLPSRYEGQKIGDTAYSQLAACGIKLAQDKSEPVDFVVIVHGSKKLQGDHISLPGEPNLSSMDTKDSVSQTIQLLKSIDTPIILCDVAYANGSDPMLLQELFNHKELVAKLWGYSGWNTTGNTIGSALSLATAKWFAENKAGYIDNHSFKQCLFTRFADDWAYQSQVRSSLSHPVTSQVLTQLMEPYLNTIANVLYYQPNGVKLSFPWNRTFEIEMDLGR